MCEANAYIVENGKEKMLLESVDVLRLEGDGVYLRSAFGEQKTVSARLKEIRLMDHKIILEKS
ncbi:MAG: CooT family nickel-binding protein [Candidatus Abyssobacteria bacterium SURF_17]|uniref:CooT family nickel-binding protein n=1 Tax=Candidatus Abyssobacteria bacterium SURF_17 TaxID=2093361 RepID=A0A419F1G4_9BACT|nr:MAG: CooT family nickel-binding protein [Candidatus Abyssubacteria bacterium SURF_17]